MYRKRAGVRTSWTPPLDARLRPYKKPIDKLIYIDVSSNHPPQIKKQVTKIISDRLSRNSSNGDTFNNTKLEYEKALKKCGHTTNLTYTPPDHEQNKKRQKRQCKIIWFNPSFNLDVSTNVAKIFLNLIVVVNCGIWTFWSIRLFLVKKSYTKIQKSCKII